MARKRCRMRLAFVGSVWRVLGVLALGVRGFAVLVVGVLVYGVLSCLSNGMLARAGFWRTCAGVCVPLCACECLRMCAPFSRLCAGGAHRKRMPDAMGEPLEHPHQQAALEFARGGGPARSGQTVPVPPLGCSMRPRWEGHMVKCPKKEGSAAVPHA